VKKLVAALITLGLAVGVLYLGLALAAGTTTGGCPTALLEGTLVEQDGTLAVRTTQGGAIARVQWPFGYSVGEENGKLTLTRVFITVAREGDPVSMGGGSSSDDRVFFACGTVAVGGAPSPD
jgi:hypothetical protein